MDAVERALRASEVKVDALQRQLWQARDELSYSKGVITALEELLDRARSGSWPKVIHS